MKFFPSPATLVTDGVKRFAVDAIGETMQSAGALGSRVLLPSHSATVEIDHYESVIPQELLMKDGMLSSMRPRTERRGLSDLLGFPSLAPRVVEVSSTACWRGKP